jgi:hypothetical protein
MSDSSDPERLRLTGDASDPLVSALKSARSDLPSDEQVRLLAARLRGAKDHQAIAFRAPVSKRTRGWQVAMLIIALTSIAVGASLLTRGRADPAPREPGTLRTASSRPPTSTLRPPAESGQIRPAGSSRSAPGDAARTLVPSPSSGAANAQDSRARSRRAEGASKAETPTDAARAHELGAQLAPSSLPVSESTGADAIPLNEAALLSRAQQVLGSSPASALALAEQHRRAFSRGRLSQERELIAIHALIALGRRSEAWARAKHFHTAYPRSAHLRRLELMLGGDAGKELHSQ